jgi:hypothetical protein
VLHAYHTHRDHHCFAVSCCAHCTR